MQSTHQPISSQYRSHSDKANAIRVCVWVTRLYDMLFAFPTFYFRVHIGQRLTRIDTRMNWARRQREPSILSMRSTRWLMVGLATRASSYHIYWPEFGGKGNINNLGLKYREKSPWMRTGITIGNCGVEDFPLHPHFEAFYLKAIWHVMNIYQKQVTAVRHPYCQFCRH